MARTTDEKLDTSINVPVPRRLKGRVKALAKQQPTKVAHTAFARTLIEEGVNRREKQVSK